MFEDLSQKAKWLLDLIPDRYAETEHELLDKAQRWLRVDKAEFSKLIQELMFKGYVYEPEPGKYRKIVIQAEIKAEKPTKADIKAVEEAKKEYEEKKKKEPLEKDYWPLGEDKGISVTLWPNNLQLQRREKQGNEWKTTQEISLARLVLEKLYIRLPSYFARMEEEQDEQAG